MVRKNYRQLLTAGCLSWIAAFILMATLVYPYASILAYLSLIFLILGTLGWVLAYKKRNGRLPNPISKYSKMRKGQNILEESATIFDASFEYAHFIWIVCFLFWSLGTILPTLLFQQGEEFKLIEQSIEDDEELLEKVGDVKYYGLLSGREVSKNEIVHIDFQIIGTKKNLDVRASLKNGVVSELKY